MKTDTVFIRHLLPICLSMLSALGAEMDRWDTRLPDTDVSLGAHRWKRQIPFMSNWFSSSPSPPNSQKQFINKGNSKTSQHDFFGSNVTNFVEEGDGTSRDGRFLSLFTVVRFDNTQCLSASGDNGTCYPQGECIRRGGAPTGKCAQGYGVCCVFSKSCGSKTFQNNTYFTHVGYPTAFDGTGSCQITIYKAAKDVCQFRLDFDSFNIAQPATSGMCTNDQFIVSGTTSPIPMICGVNSGNHMYVDVGPDNSPVTMSVITSGPTFARTWKIKVTHIRCTNGNKGKNQFIIAGNSRKVISHRSFSLQEDICYDFVAPEGCLQYYQGVSGTVRTFNFDFSAGQQLANQDYSSCIRTERNFCGIRYTVCPDSQAITPPANADDQARTQRPRGFTISGGLTTGALTGVATCFMDWVIIPCATNTGRLIQQTGGMANVCQDRLCGGLFNSEAGTTAANAVFSYVRPFRITYHTNGEETADVMNRGYCLNFIQQPCTPAQAS